MELNNDEKLCGSCCSFLSCYYLACLSDQELQNWVKTQKLVTVNEICLSVFTCSSRVLPQFCLFVFSDTSTHWDGVQFRLMSSPKEAYSGLVLPKRSVITRHPPQQNHINKSSFSTNIQNEYLSESPVSTYIPQNICTTQKLNSTTYCSVYPTMVSKGTWIILIIA